MTAHAAPPEKRLSFFFFLPFFFFVSFGLMDARSAASIKINAHTMRTVQLKTFNQNFNYQGHFFFILNKGMNSGKPLKTACPNCFVCMAESEEQKEQLYWLCYALWYSKSFHFYLKGSVIPFITLDDVRECLSKSLLKSSQYQADFQQALQQAQKFEQLEALYEKNLQLVRQARRAIFYKRHFL